MKLLALLVILLLACGCGRPSATPPAASTSTASESPDPKTTADFSPFKGPAPLLVLMTDNPWAMVIGSDTPRLVAYEDGTVIFAQDQNKIPGIWVAKLSEERLSQLLDIARPLLKLPGLKRHYDIALGVTDQPTTRVFVADKGVTKVVGVYGLSSRGRSWPEIREGEEAPPQEFMKAHKALCDYSAPDAKPWVPPFIEVMLWDYSYAPEASIIWPTKWPKLDSPRTWKRGDDYSVFLDGTELQPLKDFLATGTEKGAVEVEGKKFAAAFRFTYPSEPVWMKAFESR
jgi:hypothetical protein